MKTKTNEDIMMKDSIKSSHPNAVKGKNGEVKRVSPKNLIILIFVALGLLGVFFYYQRHQVQNTSDSDSQIDSQLITPETKLDHLLCPDDHHPHVIDLGLPSGTKWACCNIGATRPEESGGHFAWGEVEEKIEYDIDTYKWRDEVDGRSVISEVAGTKNDVAYMKWGASWRMPTDDQVIELTEQCKGGWSSLHGKNGFLATGPNGNKVFLPASGFRWGKDNPGEGTGGYYWSSSIVKDEMLNAYFIFFSSDDWDWNYYDCYLGLSVRPVCRLDQ